MSVFPEPLVSPTAERILAHTYKFVHEEWQHRARDESPDQGFENQFRGYCAMNGGGWAVSQTREMLMGLSLSTASGVSHEIDLTVRTQNSLAIFELKNKAGTPFDKNDVIVFYAKVLDYVCASPDLCQGELNLVALSTTVPDIHGITACLGLGIHPIAPGLRPLPYLQTYGLRMERMMASGLPLSKDCVDLFGDFSAELNQLLLALQNVWPSARWARQSETALFVKRVPPIDLDNVPFRLLSLNNSFGQLLSGFKAAESSPR